MMARILFVDDDSITLKMLCRIAELAGRRGGVVELRVAEERPAVARRAAGLADEQGEPAAGRHRQGMGVPARVAEERRRHQLGRGDGCPASESHQQVRVRRPRPLRGLRHRSARAVWKAVVKGSCPSATEEMLTALFLKFCIGK